MGSIVVLMSQCIGTLNILRILKWTKKIAKVNGRQKKGHQKVTSVTEGHWEVACCTNCS